jgi:hypothetical protein
MQKNKQYLWAGLAVAVAVVLAIAAVIQDQSTRVGLNNSAAVGSVASSSPVSDENITNKAEGYSFTMPRNWYSEKNGDTDLTIYPDYDPKKASSTSADCKIEISAIPGFVGDLNAWITKYLHADPTVSVSEISRNTFQLGQAGEGFGIEWKGILNGVTTTLAYIQAGGSAQGKILEIAPSTLSSTDDIEDGDCGLDFHAVLANIKIQK